ncbi:exocyst complex component Sec5 [Metarhizium album ARSEF 1941]|uniref:Exocyst complex component SEC5 n=1 Tax=Metarhizium album (strain ARSEF 1941) TaxID=1081103 RepID=A0A0B2WWJ0_METAS|nr:exocyst complex component Sec5 [Metarhizium album ARSEF 1941]KHN97984.1 exocyst complex component Sec5 [Metarhizium album ARSEF 1941]
MADYERKILEFYQLPTPFPSEWPAEKAIGEEDDQGAKEGRRKSRYGALESAFGARRSFIGENGQGGVGNLVQKDEADPLGTSDSVVRSLRQLGLPVQDDVRLRNRFMLSSTTFSPALFLSQMHSTADTNTLLQGLDVLSKSIDKKSASLKVLVESNFERFVKAKATIDNVYKEMKYRGVDPAQQRQSGRHSRHPSRTSFGRSSASGAGMGLNNPLTLPMSDSRKRNALVKESEYGVMGIKAPLLDVSAKAEDVWGPALGGREKEKHLRNVSTYLDEFRDFVELSAVVADSIKRKDYETLVDSYNRARGFADEAKQVPHELNGQALSDKQLYKLVLAGRMWHDVDQQVQAFKKDIWKKLVSLHSSRSESIGGRQQDQHMEFIGLLFELGVEENPIWVWLLSKHDHLKSKIQGSADRSKVEIEVLRRRLANIEKPAPQALASYLRTPGRQSIEGKFSTSDSTDVIELWDKMLAFLTGLVSSQGILGDLLEFWQTAQGFINGKTQQSLPVGYNGESRSHHQLSSQFVSDLETQLVELVNILREHVHAFFVEMPPEDISLLFSPPLLSPMSPAPMGGTGKSLSPTSVGDPRFNFDSSNPPPPSPKRGESWEKLAFWPPWSNSLSGVEYLSKMLYLVGSAAAEMASLGPVSSGDGRAVEQLKSLVSASRERCVTALCAAWNRDAETMKYVENWQRPAESGDVTRMPAIFAAFEGAVLSGMQKILYIPEAMEKPGAGNIVLPPPTKLLQMVRSQYVTTLYKALSGMVENAERSLRKNDDEWAVSQDASQPHVPNSIPSKSILDAGDRNIRMLLTLSNLQALRSQVVPSLNSQFENAFSVKLTDESKTIRDVLGQIDARLFQSYTKQSIETLNAIVSAGLSLADWEPPANTRPSTAKPYIYEALLALVLVHSQVSTTAPSLTSQVLSFLLEQMSLQLLDAFRKRPRYSLEALMQATVDVEFVAQTLSQYTTDKASELQSQIYQELDGRTDNDARARLQSELPEMRSILKKLREASKNEFACFKKQKRPGPKTDSAAVSTG